MNIGLWARRNFAEGEVVGAAQTGALGYFADNLTIVNLDGVVNQECFEYLKNRRAMEYIRKTNVRHLLLWTANEKFFRTSQNKSATDQ